MTRRALLAALILAVAAGALAFRLPRLALRPLHCDEAIEAVKTGTLLDRGVYRYDPQEYHGPTLHYATLPFLWLSGAKSYAESSEVTYRLVDVAFGVGLILLLPLLADGLGWPAVLVAGILTAISPAFVFYNRYYIHESLLVFFTMAAIATAWRYARCGKLVWAILAAAALALMHATKETCVLAFAAMALALVAKFGWRKLWREPINVRGLIKGWHVAVAVAAGLVVSVVFFTSFFSNWRGPLDSILTFGNYFHRSGGAGLHDHPWHYYLGMLAYTQYGRGPWWSEGLILALALIGIVAALWPSRPERPKPPLLRFLAFYTLLLTTLYAIVPYKTPWCMLSFLHGMILMAGVGAVALVRRVPTHLLKGIVALVLALAAWQLAGQAYRASLDRRFVCDPRNPYVYAQTTSDLLEIPRRAEQLAQVSPAGYKMIIKIIAPDSDYWPLPFYLRRFPRVGCWPKVDPATGRIIEAMLADPDADLIIASSDVADELEKRLRDSYFTETRGLRPRVLLRVYIRKPLWDALLARLAQTASP